MKTAQEKLGIPGLAKVQKIYNEELNNWDKSDLLFWILQNNDTLSLLDKNETFALLDHFDSDYVVDYIISDKELISSLFNQILNQI